MNEVTHIFIVLLLVVLMYYAWMDVALYYKLQSQTDNLLLTQNYIEDRSNANIKQRQNTTSTTPIQSFDAFNPISLKLLVLDHSNHYIYYPLGSWIDIDILHISEKLIFITPDMISLSHVMVAAFGAKFLASELLLHRRLGVLLFELRSFLDSLDGLVARTRVRERAMIADSTKWGYWMDGLCDLTGTIFFMIAVIMICQRSLQLRRTVTFQIVPIFYYILAPFKRRISKISLPSDSDLDTEAFLSTSKADGKNKNGHVHIPKVMISNGAGKLGSLHSTSGILSFKQSTVVVACLSLLQFLSSWFWNRYMEKYHMLLEVPIQTTATSSGTAESFQLETMRSAAFWIIVWSWRLLNPHAIMSVLLVSIFFDREVELFLWLQWLGFLPLLGLIFTSEVHLQATGWKLWYLTH